MEGVQTSNPATRPVKASVELFSWDISSHTQVNWSREKDSLSLNYNRLTYVSYKDRLKNTQFITSRVRHAVLRPWGIHHQSHIGFGNSVEFFDSGGGLAKHLGADGTGW